MAHTPGPWTVKSSDLPGGFLEIISPSYRKETDADHVVCELRRWRRPSPEDNARLIAAAPELLAVLERCNNRWDDADEEDNPALGQAIRAAIAKAKGKEGEG